jgi:preprotein translocase subunit SecY
LGLLIPIPFLDAGCITGQFRTFIPDSPNAVHFSLGMLGIMPYVSAYILVEISSLCIPFLKKLRSGSFEGRRKLKRLAFALALPLAAFQANGILSGIEGMNLSNGNPVITLFNSNEYLIVLCLLVFCFYLLVALCELITRFGIGHGISIIILTGICSSFLSWIPDYFEQFGYYDLPIHMLFLTGMFVYLALPYVLLKAKIPIRCYHEKDNTKVDYFELNMAPSSKEALSYSFSIVMLPLMLSSFFDTSSSVADMLHPGSLWYSLLVIFSIFVFSYLFSWAFLHPRRRVDTMRKRGWHIADIDMPSEKFLLRKQFKYTLPWTIYLCIIATVSSMLIYTIDFPFFIGGSALLIIVAISLDLMCGFRFYKKNIPQPIKIAEYHDIYDANMIRNHLKAMGIMCHLRGYHHRLLSYFFGPHIDMSLIIDTQDTERVQMLIQDYYGGLGLCRTSAK